MAEDFVLFAGTANPELAELIAYQLAVPLAACVAERFPDGEVSLHLAA
jgi:ribose-phosphate pyrophosphokinase